MKKLLVLCLLVGAAILAGLYLIQGWSGAGPADRPTPVLIASGSSLASAAEQLEEAGVIASAGRFLLQAKVFGGSAPIQAGEFEFPARASHSQVLAMLQNGKTLQRMVTIPEGLPSVLVHERLVNAPTLTGEVPVPEEGSILPDSYSYQRGESRAAVLDRMQKAMVETLAELWPKRSPDSVATTPEEAVILASIVEKETG